MDIQMDIPVPTRKRGEMPRDDRWIPASPPLGRKWTATDISPHPEVSKRHTCSRLGNFVRSLMSCLFRLIDPGYLPMHVCR